MPSTFRAFAHRRRDSLTVSELNGFIQDWNDYESVAARKAGWWFATSLLLALVGVALLIASDESVNPARQLVAGGLLMSALMLFAVSVIMGLTFAQDEIDAARRAISLLSEQDAIIERAMALAKEARGLALFLRSFDVEDSGASQAEIEGNLKYAGDFEWNMREQTQGHASGPPPGIESGELPIVANVWTRQLETIALLHSRIPTVLLENITTESSKRAELEAFGVIVVPVLTGDWWQVFLRLFEECRCSVFFVGDVSPALRREMIHAAVAATHPYAVVDDSEATGVDPELQAFLEKSSLRIRSSERGRLDGWLSEHRLA
jgi:hypothetical protein